MRRPLLAIALPLLLAACTTPPTAFKDPVREAPLHQLKPAQIDQFLGQLQARQPDLRQRVATIARRFLNQPYELYLLGEFPYELYDPQPLFNLESSDCVVFVEHVYAMALSRNWAEFFWMLQTPAGLHKFEVHGPFDSDDGDVLTGWALSARGIINKPRFEVEPYIRDRRLKVILPANPPTPVQFAAVYPHKKLQDPKVRLLLDFMAERCQRLIRDILKGG